MLIILVTALLIGGCDSGSENSVPTPLTTSDVYELIETSVDGVLQQTFNHDEAGRILIGNGAWTDDSSYEGFVEEINFIFNIDEFGYYTQVQNQVSGGPVATTSYIPFYLNGLLQSIQGTFPDGSTELQSFQYDNGGRLIQKRAEESGSIFEDNLRYFKGQVSAVDTYWQPDVTTPKSLFQTITYNYDSENLTIREIKVLSNNGQSQVKIYQYQKSEKCVPLSQYFIDDYVVTCGSIF